MFKGKRLTTSTTIITVIVVLVVIVAVFYVLQNTGGNAGSNTAIATSTTAKIPSKSVATSSAKIVAGKITTTAVTAKAFTIDPRDKGFSWKLSNNAPTSVIQKSTKLVQSLTGELHKGKHSDYDIYLQLGQEYEILNEGKQAYESYNSAAALEPNQGVAMSNIGSLMAKLGALHTAQNAYAQSVARQPSASLFWVLYLKFLTQYQPRATGTPSVFASARKITKDNTNIIITQAQWLASIGNNKSAIAAWEIVRARVSGSQQKAIDARIVSLKANI